MTANWFSQSGWQSTFAPQSMSRKLPLPLGSSGASAGRSMPGMRPRRNMPPASTAPVEPADTKPSASLSRTCSIPITVADFVLRRTPITGLSWLVMTSGASSTVRRLRTSSQAVSRGVRAAGSPARVISNCGNFRRASIAPATGAWGALSPPMASRKIRIRGASFRNESNE